MPARSEHIQLLPLHIVKRQRRMGVGIHHRFYDPRTARQQSLRKRRTEMAWITDAFRPDDIEILIGDLALTRFHCLPRFTGSGIRCILFPNFMPSLYETASQT